MYETHTVNDGTTTLIAQMADNHLINTVRTFANRLTQSRLILENQHCPGNTLIKVLQPDFSSEAVKEKAQDVIRYYHHKLQPYIVEAALRGLDVTESLQKAYDRSAQLPTSVETLLPAALGAINNAFSDDSDY